MTFTVNSTAHVDTITKNVIITKEKKDPPNQNECTAAPENHEVKREEDMNSLGVYHPNPSFPVRTPSRITSVPLEYAIDAIARTQSEKITVLYRLMAFDSVSLISHDAYSSCTRIVNDLV